MSFLNPLFLIALVSVGVPVLIYLLNLRKPQKVKFSTLAFFDVLKTTSLKRIKIKRWLLLAIRCAAVIMLVLAASRPFLPPLMGFEGGNNEPKSIGILIDNSPSMNQVDSGGPFWEQALSTAKSVISLAGNEDKIYLEVSNGPSTKSPGYSADAAEAFLSELEVKNGGNYTSLRLRNLASRLNDSPEPVDVLYIITDGQQTQFAELFSTSAKNSSVSVQVFKVGETVQDNVHISSVEMVSGNPGGSSEIEFEVTVENSGSSPVKNYFLSAELNGEMTSQIVLNLDAKSSKKYKMNLPSIQSDAAKAVFFIEGDEYTFDNRYNVAIQEPEPQNILVLQNANGNSSFQSYLKPLMQAASVENRNLDIRFEEPAPSLISEFQNFDSIVLDGLEEIPEYAISELADYVQSGNGLLFLPSATGEMNNYNRFFSSAGAGRFANVTGSYGSFRAIDRLSAVTEGHPVLDEMFEKQEDEEVKINAPEIFYYYQQAPRESSSVFTIASTQTGEPLLVEYKTGSGIFIISGIGSDPGWSNFPVKPLFAPLLYRTVMYLTSVEADGLEKHVLGNKFRNVLPSAPEEVVIFYKEKEIIPEVSRIYRGTEITYTDENWEPGWLELNADGKKRLIALNQNAMESNFETLDMRNLEAEFESVFPNILADQIGTDIEDAEKQIQSASFGREIWYWFIITAIVLLLLESIISRSYKAETIQ